MTDEHFLSFSYRGMAKVIDDYVPRPMQTVSHWIWMAITGLTIVGLTKINLSVLHYITLSLSLSLSLSLRTAVKKIPSLAIPPSFSNANIYHRSRLSLLGRINEVIILEAD